VTAQDFAKNRDRGFSLLILLIFLGLVVGVVGVVVAVGPSKIPMLNYIDQRLKNIRTPIPLLNSSLTPARDLRGTWRSALNGKGIQLYGQFNTGPGTTKVYEDGNMELIINNVTGNTAVGTIRYTNLCSTGSTEVPGFGTVSVPPQCVSDTGTNAIQIRISSTHLDFGTVRTNGATFTMQGNFTTDLISGTMTATTPYGDIKGEFHLMRAH